MQAESLDCPICSEKYDITIRLPRLIPVCGHTVCSQCILNLIKRPGNFICPIGKEVLRGDHSKLDSFPPNFTLRSWVEKSLEFGLCTNHKKELQYFCPQDKQKVCHECALFGGHANHEIKPLSDLKPAMEKKINKLQDILQATEEYYKKTERFYKDQRNQALSLVYLRFKDLEYMLKAKEAEFVYNIKSFYDKEIEKFDLQVGRNSLAIRILKAKISEYEQISKQPNPFELLEEDFSDVPNIIKEAIQLDTTHKIEPSLTQLKRDISLIFDSQLASFQNFKIPTQNFPNLGEPDLKLDEKLSARKELSQYKLPISENPPDPSLEDLFYEEDGLEILYPFRSKTRKNLDFIQGVPENITFFGFHICQNISTIPPEDISMLCFIRNGFPNIEEIEISIENPIINDQILLDVFTCLFWNNSSLKSISLRYGVEGTFEKSILYLTENVLPRITDLKEFMISFPKSGATHRAYNSLVQSIMKIADNLTTLVFGITCRDADTGSLQKLFVRMPNLEVFSYELSSRKFTDDVLNKFIENMRPSLKKLTEFELSINESTVSKVSIKKIFEGFPKEWFSTIKVFTVGLSKTKVTDECLEKFMNQALPKFEALEQFSLETDHTQVTPGMRDVISQWESEFPGQNESTTSNSTQ